MARPEAKARRAAVLEALRTHGPLTKEQIAQRTGLGITYVNSAIGYLNLWGKVQRQPDGGWQAASPTNAGALF